MTQRVRSRASARIRRDTFPLRKPACGDRIRGGFARQRRRAHAALRRSRPPVRGSQTHSRDRHGRTRRRHIYARNVLHPAGHEDRVATEALQRRRPIARLRPDDNGYAEHRMQPADRTYGAFQGGRSSGRDRIFGRCRHDMGRFERRRRGSCFDMHILTYYHC